MMFWKNQESRERRDLGTGDRVEETAKAERKATPCGKAFGVLVRTEHFQATQVYARGELTEKVQVYVLGSDRPYFLFEADKLEELVHALAHFGELRRMHNEVRETLADREAGDA